MIADALGYPLAGDDGRIAVAAGGAGVVALAIGVRFVVAALPSPFALVPVALVFLLTTLGLGYLSIVLVDGGESPPRLESVRSLLRPGAVALALSVVYLLPPTVAQFVTVYGALGAGTDGGETYLFLLSSTVTLFTAMAFVYALPAAVAAATRTGRLRTGFDPGAVLPPLREGTYLFAWTVGLGLLGVGGFFAAATVGGGGLLGLLSAFPSAYCLLAGVRAIGTGYARATASGETASRRSNG